MINFSYNVKGKYNIFLVFHITLYIFEYIVVLLIDIRVKNYCCLTKTMKKYLNFAKCYQKCEYLKVLI